MHQDRRYWFKAKSSGLGWSTPLVWQGWLVYTAMFSAMGYLFFTGVGIGQKLLGVWLPILACLPIFWLFGEPLSARRSDRRSDRSRGQRMPQASADSWPV